MKRYVLLVFMGVMMFTSCSTKYNYIDTGLADGEFEGNMYEYLQSNSYDWDSTVLLIERAGLVDLFEGKREGFEKITFFGPTNLSIIRWMIQEGYETIEDVPVELCNELILRHVVKGETRRDDVPRGEVVLGQLQGNGGQVMTSLWGTEFWIYSHQDSYENIPGVGPIILYIVSLDKRTSINVASTNIETTTGVVHSLQYDYTLGEL